jgi:hypothetical protein
LRVADPRGSGSTTARRAEQRGQLD